MRFVTLLLMALTMSIPATVSADFMKYGRSRGSDCCNTSCCSGHYHTWNDCCYRPSCYTNTCCHQQHACSTCGGHYHHAANTCGGHYHFAANTCGSYYHLAYDACGHSHFIGGYAYYPSWNNGYSYVIYAEPTAVSTPVVISQPVVASTTNNVAQLEVKVPDVNDTIIIQDQKMSTTGQTRLFSSPTLESGKNYTYTIKFQRNVSGKAEEEIRTVDVQAGSLVTVDFTKPKAEKRSAPVASK